MATSITRLVANRVFRNHRVSRGLFVTVNLLRVAKWPSFLSQQNFLSICVLMGGNCRRRSRLDGHKKKTRLATIESMFVVMDIEVHLET